MPSLDPKPSRHCPSDSAKFYREMAERYWRAAEGMPDPNPIREEAMRLHTQAIMIEAGVMEDAL